MTKELRLIRLRLRNFMRFGDKWTDVDLSKDGLVLVLGKNGHGKSTVFDAISFALTGKAVRRTLPGRMVNRINKREMLVVLDVEVGDSEARIVRGMKPGVCKFYKRPISKRDEGDIEQPAFDRTLDSIQRTSDEIERFTRIDHELFVAMVINSTRRMTFIQSDSSVQKATVESLFGFKILTEKAALIKAKRETLESELTTKSSALAAKQAAREIAMRQHEIVISKRDEWNAQRAKEIAAARVSVSKIDLSDHDVIRESLLKIAAHQEVVRSAEETLRMARAALHSSAAKKEHSRLSVEIDSARRLIALHQSTDFDSEIATHSDIALVDLELAEMEKKKWEFSSALNAAEAAYNRATKAVSQAKAAGEKCPTCGQEWPDLEAKRSHVTELEMAVGPAKQEMDSAVSALSELLDQQSALRSEVDGFKKSLKTKSIEEAERLKVSVAESQERLKSLMDQLEETSSAIEKLASEETAAIAALESVKRATPPSPRLSSLVEIEREIQTASAAASKLTSLETERNPYEDMIAQTESSIPSEIDTTEVANLEKLVKHCEFLEKVLVRKDSPVRRAVTSTYLPPLNTQLNKYLSKLGLPYTVEFNDELEPVISDGGDDVDPGAISGGEEERLAMSLSWAFRDAYEEINGVRLCFSGIDERLDSGLDTSGAESAISQLKETSLQDGRTVWLITHRREFEDHADHVLVVDRGDGRFSDAEWR